MKNAITVAVLLVLGAVPAHAGNRPQASAKQAPAAKSAPAQAASAPAKIDPAKEADIRKLLDVTGAGNLALQTMTEMEKNMRPMLTSAFPPGEYREKLIDLFIAKFHSKADAQTIVNLAVPVYDKYFTGEEIKGLIQFYGTPLGKKTLQSLPQLMGELQAQGQQWGQQLGRASMEEVLAEHPELAKALEDAQKAKQR